MNLKKEVSPATAIAVIAVVVLIVGFFLYRAFVGERPSMAPSQTGLKINELVNRTGGDARLLTPEERKLVIEAIQKRMIPPGIFRNLEMTQANPTR
ncbi:MAG: hypothetical protein HPY54_10925 [Chthonomonadetes bacterium]|nr:hypothetical protein [Chthonomonadetes bacterium]